MVDTAYVRVSSDEQVKHGISIDAQISEMKAKGILKENIFVEEGKSAGIGDEDFSIINDENQYGISFNKSKRPAFKELLKRIKSGDKVYFTRWDRISRNVAFLEIFVLDCHSRNIKLIPINDLDNKLTRQLLSVVGENELDKLKERIFAVRKQQFQIGVHGFKVPLGYAKNKDKTIRINPKEAELVRMIFKMSAEGLDYKNICNALGIKHYIYYHVLKNDIYIGNIHLGDEVKKGIHEPIISQELWDKTRDKVSSHSHFGIRK